MRFLNWCLRLFVFKLLFLPLDLALNSFSEIYTFNIMGLHIRQRYKDQVVHIAIFIPI